MTRANENELPSIKAKLHSFGFENWYPATVSYYAGKRATPENIKDMTAMIPLNPKYRERFDIMEGKVVGHKNSCGCMIPNISPTGDVSLCFYDMLHEVKTGNILEIGSLRKILNSQKFRQDSKLGREMKLNICDGCN